MKTKTIEPAAQGVAVLTPEQFKEALKKDFDMLAALINFIRSEPRCIEALAEIANQLAENRLIVQEAQKRAMAETQIGTALQNG